MQRLLFFCFVISILTSVGCKKDNPLKGIDTNALFAEPTTEELAAIRSDWQQRDLTPIEVKIEETHVINSDLSLHIISYRLESLKQYAGVLVPAVQTRLPIRVFISGFGLDVRYSYQNMIINPVNPFPFVHIVPALRGQSLELVINGTTYKTPIAEGSRDDAFDAAADDAIGAINAVASQFPNMDASRILTWGASRGGTVAMLVGIRDSRVKKVLNIVGPTEFLQNTKDHQTDPTYKFQFLDSLIAGKFTLQQTRFRMIASSPLYFCRDLPKTQIHLGEKDWKVPPAHGTKLKDALSAIGRGNDLELFIYPGRDHEGIGVDNAELNTQIAAFMQF